MLRLRATIEGEIIPRLLLALQTAPAAAAPEGIAWSQTGEDEIGEFARLVATHDVSVASAYVTTLLNRGVALEKVYLDLFAPAARLLGEWCSRDVRDYGEVTDGLCRMHQLLHEFSSRFLHDAQPTTPERCVLLAAMPGEQHCFGLIMVGEFFRREGWDVWEPHPDSEADLLRTVARQWFSVISVSVSRDARLPELPALIGAMRRASRNQAVSIMVCGQPFVGHPERVFAVGADATATDGRLATQEAARLVDARARRA